jgi:hypothetical protein
MRIYNASISDEELALSVGYPSVGVENAIAELEIYRATWNLAQLFCGHDTFFSLYGQSMTLSFFSQRKTTLLQVSQFQICKR